MSALPIHKIYYDTIEPDMLTQIDAALGNITPPSKLHLVYGYKDSILMTPSHLNKIRNMTIGHLPLSSLDSNYAIEEYISALKNNKHNPVIHFAHSTPFVMPEELLLLLQSFRITSFTLNPLIINAGTRNQLVDILTEPHNLKRIGKPGQYICTAYTAQKFTRDQRVKLHAAGLLNAYFIEDTSNDDMDDDEDDDEDDDDDDDDDDVDDDE